MQHEMFVVLVQGPFVTCARERDKVAAQSASVQAREKERKKAKKKVIKLKFE